MVLQYKAGGIFPLRLNISDRPIGNKYLEGKLKRTLKRELKLPEIVVVEGLTGTLVGVGWTAYCWLNHGWNGTGGLSGERTPVI